ncbi:hypothetical protein STK_02530 [Sulfurisphaera tokodaii str. 7]|uniref:Uncharacterized protein n=1 Tax=Sulfurisphaera tokodaii (strain DSM 16993 / JCM 10545 / NBRC 100140 / 7) TaxID=273063 RepID=Q976C8_SULTO|nr:hypothetical protein [Sulfurisphaera tokodaii]BAB65219.1 hypothetical protein STK_02530 [Sulfurisphaera tokodaii str. 7]
MKQIEIETVLPMNYKKLRAFFITDGVLRLFYEINKIEQTGNLTWLINGKYNAIVYFSEYDINWEIYRKRSIKDRISVFLYPVADDSGLRLIFRTNRVLPLKKSLENEVNAGIELLKSLLYSLRI